MNTNVEGFTNKIIINQEAAQWVLLLEDTPELSKQQISELNTWVATSEVHRECLENMVSKGLISREVARDKAKIPENF